MTADKKLEQNQKNQKRMKYRGHVEGDLGHLSTHNDGTEDKSLSELGVVTLQKITDVLHGILFIFFHFVVVSVVV